MANRKYEEAIRKYHRFKVTVCETGQNAGKLTTYVQKEGAPRQKKVFRSWKEAHEWLQAYYLADGPTLTSIFPEWLKWKSVTNANKPETVALNQAAFHSILEGTPIAKKPISQITVTDCEDWVVDLLSKRSMTRKRFNTQKIVVSGPLQYAVRKGLIQKNPFNDISLNLKKLLKTEQKAPSETKIFYDHEVAALKKAFVAAYESNGNTANIALLINFNLGLRVGELSSLKWGDVNWIKNTIFVRRQESDGEVEEMVKADSPAGYRELRLNSEAQSWLKHLKEASSAPPDGFIFINLDGGRVTNAALSNRLRHAQEGLGFDVIRGTHAMRRTFASKMFDQLGAEATRRWLGHTDIETTLKYVYSTRDETETVSFLENLNTQHILKICKVS